MIEALLGFSPQEVKDPVPLENVQLSPLRDPPGKPPSCITIKPEDRVRHSYGRSYLDQLRGFSGDFNAAPDLVAYPQNEQQLEEVLSWADSHQVTVVPFGGGTSVVGGVEGPRETSNYLMSLDLTGLNKVLEVDLESRLARIQAGIKGPHLEEQLREHGLSLRHYPQSFEFSTLGGWIATRAGGHFATLYTHIDQLVASIRSISPQGWIDTRPLPASGAGPSPDSLLLGSEGILGVISEATVRLRPRPNYRASATVHFERLEQAVEAARTIAQSGLHPTNCRILDAKEAAFNGVSQDGKTLLLLGFEAKDRPLDSFLAQAMNIAEKEGGECPKGPRYRHPQESQDGAAAWKSAFIQAPYLQPQLISLGVMADTFETCVSWRTFPKLHQALMEGMKAKMRELTGAGKMTCRFTHVYHDGPAPYYTFLCPVRPGQEQELWWELKNTASELLLEYGATITHHHAVGRTHGPYYRRQVPQLFQKMLQAAKDTVDPQGILNPGVLLDGRS